MFEIREASFDEKQVIDRVADIHVLTFQGFFLTFLGKGFVKHLYCSFCKHPDSGLLIAVEDGDIIGFLAYSSDYSGLFKYMIKTKLVPFAWYSLGAFFRKPKVFMRLVRAFLKPGETKRTEKYVELSSIGVDPDYKGKGVGTKLIDVLKQKVDFQKYEYITLETDAEKNDAAIHFYEKNEFVREREFATAEGRKMYEYRFRRTV
jgi:ribosomal protein S18 acetylase RimI-like enzyme